METKKCSLCKEEKTVDLFGKCKGSKDGLYFWCKACKSKKSKFYYVGEAKERRQKANRESYYKNAEDRKAKGRAWHNANKDRARQNRLKRIYGIDDKDYEMMSRYQENKCAICQTKTEVKLVVDHKHSTEEVRGLLCSACNSMLGYAKENPDILNRAIDYLTDYPAQFLPIKRTQSCLI
jgi:hypothetical protein